MDKTFVILPSSSRLISFFRELPYLVSTLHKINNTLLKDFLHKTNKMTNPLAGLERTVGKEMFDKVRREKGMDFFVFVSYRNIILV